MKILKKLNISLLAILCLFSLSACQSNQQRQASEQGKLKKEDNTLPTGNYFSDDSQQKLENEERNRGLNNVTHEMNQNYEKIGSVKNSNNTLTLDLKGEQMQELDQEVQQGNSQARKFWNELTTGMQKTSKTLSHQLHDDQLTLRIVNTNNNLLYSVQDGSVNVNKLK